MTIAVTGASGFIGQQLIASWPDDEVRFLALGRSTPRLLNPRMEFSAWELVAGEPARGVIERSDAVIHLAGEPVAQRWNDSVKLRIRDSRVAGTRNLVSAIAKADRRPHVLVCASAVGYYGDRGDELLEESAPPGAGFLSDVCRAWEAEADRAASLGVRVVKIRTGFVLGRGGGALRAMLPAFRLGLGARLGDGKQWMSWIHIDDLTGMIRHAVRTSSASGAWNGTAPAPVTNAIFTKEFGRAVHRPAFWVAPRFLVELGAGEMAQILFFSQRCAPKGALGAGYRFEYPELGPALEAVVR